jgi:catalase
VAPTVGGIKASDGKRVEADRQVDGGRQCSTTRLSCSSPPRAPRPWPGTPAARDFVTDAYAHCKFIGYVAQATDSPAKLLAYRRALFEVVRRRVA